MFAVWFATFSGIIGKATVERLALEGASVAMFINDSENSERVELVAWLPEVWSAHFLRSQQGRVFRKCPAVC